MCRVKTRHPPANKLLQIQKGVLQLGKGLSFLHTSARTIHSNINPESILINNAVRTLLELRLDALSSYLQGDWKLGGLGLAIPLKRPDGSSTDWEFPSYDSRMPSYAQRSFDYIGIYKVLSCRAWLSH